MQLINPNTPLQTVKNKKQCKQPQSTKLLNQQFHNSLCKTKRTAKFNLFQQKINMTDPNSPKN